MEIVEVHADFTGDGTADHVYEQPDINEIILDLASRFTEYANSLQQRINELEANQQ